MANIFLDRSNLIRTPVSALKIGVFVAELDRPWLETPFLVQGFVIKNQSEIRKLGQYCDYVYVEKQGRQWTKSDPFKSPMGIKRSTMGADDKGQHLRRAVSRKSLTATLGQRSSYEVSVKAPEEHAQAREIHLEARGAVVNILDQARMGAAIETETAKRVVKSCVESMLRNPHALMWMAKIKHADQYTLEHCLNVSILAIAFGRHLRLEKTDIEKLGICGLLHDVGKMQVPDEILNKPDKLTDEEMDVMRSHATLGRELLMSKKDAMTYTIDVTFNHHERVDGTGYPRGLHAHEISDFAKIITIVDAFDAMTSDRCYDEAKTSVDALRE
ncbi:MAG: HD-GYP domain-containing protein, partial [bacterium]